MSDPLREELVRRIDARRQALVEAKANLAVFLDVTRNTFDSLKDFVKETGATVSENPISAFINIFGQQAPYEQVLHVRLDAAYFDLTSRIQSLGISPRNTVFTFQVNAPRYSPPFQSSQVLSFDPKSKEFHVVTGAILTSAGPVFDGPKATLDDLKRAIIEALAP